MKPEEPVDEIVEEVRRNREELLRASGGNIRSLVAMLNELESKETRPIVNLPPRRISSSESDAA